MRPMSMGRLVALASAALLLAGAASAGSATAVPANADRGRAAEALNWVALGDSYSADVMVPPWDAPADSDGCGRSGFNWEAMLARDLNAEHPGWVNVTDVTCGAATIAAGVLGPQPAGMLFGPPSNGKDHGGWVTKRPQIDAVNADTDIVTVGIGGNDFGFGDILNNCLAIGAEQTLPVKYCKTYYESEAGQHWLNERFQILEVGLQTLVADIHSRAPGAKVFLLGYPAIVPSAFGCSYGNFHQLGTVRLTNDAPYLNSLQQQLNQKVADAADENQAVYVDTYTSSTGHGVCATGSNRWMYGIFSNLVMPPGVDKPADPAQYQCPAREQVPAELPKGEACTFVHPNYYGAVNQRNQAEAAFQAAGLTP
ncbi:SGNH/GDSL hydrolase family protein [Streptomyces sp. NPDC059456]|uniref:SGNH/GDSL hydrolase family protein n=1 Tax=Streptomyces sp. NPDC059456 TaxID=3346838 RepID=UPI0036B4AD52